MGSVEISEKEFDDDIMIRRKGIFETGENVVKTEGRMYYIMDSSKGKVLGALNL